MPNKAKYTFNNNKYSKNGLVLAVVKQYVQDRNPTYQQLKDEFPTCNSHYVVISADDLSDRNEDRIRHFHLVKDHLKTSDGKTVYVSTQWKIGNIGKFIAIARTLGYEINEVSDAMKSIRDLFDEYMKNPETGWIAAYEIRCNQVKALKGKPPEAYTKSVLEDIWKKSHNGISKVGQGVLSNEEFEKLLPDLPEITSQIVDDPSPETLTKIRGWAKSEKEKGNFNSVKRGAINRVFAAADPHSYSSILKRRTVSEFIKRLNNQYDLKIDIDKINKIDKIDNKSNWCQLNIALMKALKSQGLDDENVYYINTFAWELHNELAGDNNTAVEEDEDENEDEETVDKPIGKNIIYYGPPGTGKTHKLQTLLKDDYTEERFKFVTFHQSYGYEEFVEGLRPKLDLDNEAEISYEIKPGIFREICEMAKDDPKNNYAIFIDEINRGNISKIFGELITLIETDKRTGANNALAVTLPYSNESFSVPQNLDIIGTMNTADRSLTHIDVALRRRFEFEELSTDYSLILGNIQGINLRRMLYAMNQRIELLLDRDHILGHAALMAEKVSSLDDLIQVFKTKFIPQLEEYFFEDREKIDQVLNSNGFFEERKNVHETWLGKSDDEYTAKSFKFNTDSLNTIPPYKLIYESENLKDSDFIECDAA